MGLSRAAWYRPPLDWTVRDAELIAALAGLVEDRPSRGFWKCRKLLRRSRPEWSHKQIYRVYKAMRLNLRRAAKRRRYRCIKLNLVRARVVAEPGDYRWQSY